jgi:hypothetical protein
MGLDKIEEALESLDITRQELQRIESGLRMLEKDLAGIRLQVSIHGLIAL